MNDPTKEKVNNHQTQNNQNNIAQISNGMQDYQQFKKDMNHSNNTIKNINQNNQSKVNPNFSQKNNAGVQNLKNNAAKRGAAIGMQAMGVPKPIADKVASSEKMQKALNKSKSMQHLKNPFKSLGANLLGLNKNSKKEKLKGNNGSDIDSVAFEVPKKAIKIFAIMSAPMAMFLLFFVIIICIICSTVSHFIGSSDEVTENELKNINDSFGYFDSTNESDIVLTNSKITIEPEVKLVVNKAGNDADLSDLNGMFGDKLNCEKEDCKKQPEYQFYLKLHDIYYRYKKKYKVKLDLRMITATLSLQDADTYNIFINNLNDYDRNEALYSGNFDQTLNIDWEYDYEKNLGDKYLSSSYDNFDMQILAKAMVTQDSNSNYKLDMDNYNKFLNTYLEFKYILTDEKKRNVNPTTDGSLINNKNYNKVLKYKQSINDVLELYDYIAGPDTEEEETDYENVTSTNNSFWWPIGGSEITESNGKKYAKGDPTTTLITSPFGYRLDPFGSGETYLHGGIDIAGGDGENNNIIASRSGTVVYPLSKDQTKYENGGSRQDGGGYGNYIIIQHSDGSFTVYAHLSPNTISVLAGETVEQGQVIGKMGTSGDSTGVHLHFEVRIGGDGFANRTDPLEYVNPDDPRPAGSGANWSITTTSLSKEEFIAKMSDYCNRAGNQNFCNNFSKNASSIYDASLKNNVNPELVVVTAGTEQSWTNPGGSNNYWGIGVPNGATEAPAYNSLESGIKAYAETLNSYLENGYFANTITEIYNQRLQAGCKVGGYGLPGTIEGMQSIYSSIGSYRYNPGGPSIGGCYYFNGYIYADNYCSTVPTCTPDSSGQYNNCPLESATTACEKSDYTIYQLTGKIQLRFDIFGL